MNMAESMGLYAVTSFADEDMVELVGLGFFQFSGQRYRFPETLYVFHLFCRADYFLNACSHKSTTIPSKLCVC